MHKRRIFWPEGNMRFDAWEIDSPAGQLVVRRNHQPVRSGTRQCQGLDLWLNGKHLGAVGSRNVTELTDMTHRQLKRLARPLCCSRYTEFPLTFPSHDNWGGSRQGAGRPPKGEAKRVKLCTTVSRRTLSLIDRARGDASRGEYLDQLFQKNA